jgi:hypothetical protein
MFIISTKELFEPTLHQLAANTSDMTYYIAEGNAYVPSIDAQTKDKWEKEIRLKMYQFTNDARQLALTFLNGISKALLDEQGNFIYDEGGNIILDET